MSDSGPVFPEDPGGLSKSFKEGYFCLLGSVFTIRSGSSGPRNLFRVNQRLSVRL